MPTPHANISPTKFSVRARKYAWRAEHRVGGILCFCGGMRAGACLRPAVHTAVRRQSGTTDFIKQRPITDAQGPGCLFAVPVMGLQDFENDLVLQFAHCLTRNFLKRHLPFDRYVRSEIFVLPTHNLTADNLLIS